MVKTLQKTSFYSYFTQSTSLNVVKTSYERNNKCKPSSKTSHLVYVLMILFGALHVSGQTTLISPTGDGGFENGTTFAANGWSVSNSSNNPWVIGTANTTTPFSNRTCYISDNGGVSANYTPSNNATNYFWRDITVPAGESVITLTFNWQQQGESTWDIWQVYYGPTTITPVGVASHPGSGTTLIPPALTGATVLGAGSLLTGVQTITLSLPASLAGTTFRLFFSWKNEAGGTQPPAIIDNISLTSAAPSTFTASALGGLWSSPATWVGGVVPPVGNDISIPTGTIVTVDQVTSYRNLDLGGTLQWNATANAMTLSGNLTINTTGKLNLHTTASAVATINIGGNFTNNGTANLALGSLNFNGSGSTFTGSTLSGTGTFVGDGTRGLIRGLAFQNLGANTINTTQNLTVTSGFSLTAGSLNTNGKLKIDNTAQVFGQAINTQVASAHVTALGATLSATPVVTGAATTQWTNIATLAANTLVVSGANLYRVVAAATTVGPTAPTHTAGVAQNLLWVGTVGTIGNPYQTTAPVVGTQYFYGGNLYTAIATTAGGTTPPTHTSGVVGSYLYVGTPASVSINFDATTQTVRSLNIVNAGSGYASAPTITFSIGAVGATGTLPTATAVLFQSIAGPANSLTQKSGVATISGGLTINSDQGASILAPTNSQSSSGVGAIFTTNGGVNYTVAPTVGFAGPTALNLVTNGGSGYTSAPTVTVTGGNLVTGTALTSANFTITVNQGKVVSVYLNPSTTATYSIPPTLSFTGGGGTGATLGFPSGCWPAATAILGTNRQITNFTVTNSGYGYVVAPTLGIGTTSGSANGGTFTTVATVPTARLGLYNLTLNFFAPAASSVAQADVPEIIPANRKINVLALAGNGNGLNLSDSLILFGTAPFTLTASSSSPGNVLNLGGKTLHFSWNGYAGVSSTFGVTNAYLKNGSMTLTGRGGGTSGSSFNYPFSGTVTIFTGSGTSAADGGDALTVKVTETSAPDNTTNTTGTAFAQGKRAFRLRSATVLNASSTFGNNPTVKLNFNSQDSLLTIQNQTLIAQSTALTGPWFEKTATFSALTTALPATGTLTTATAAPGPIVLTGDDYFAWASNTLLCSGLPDSALISPSNNLTCINTGVSPIATGATTSVGASYQWMVSTSPSGPFVNLTSGTGLNTLTPTFTSSVADTFYYVMKTTCAFSGLSRLSSVDTVLYLGGSITSSPSYFCGTGGNTTLTLSSPVTPTSIAWTSLTASATVGTSTTSTNTFAVTETSDVQADVTYTGGVTCPVFLSVGVYDLPSATVTTTANGVCPGTSATINSGLTAGNFTASCITPAPKTIPATATFLVNNGTASVPLASGTLDDGGWSNIPIGFNFNFFGTNFSTINVGTNGVLQFGTYNATALGDFTIGALPNTSDPLGAIYASANDLHAGTTGTPSTYIQYWTEGFAPNRKFVIEYNVFQFGSTTSRQNMQVILYETTGLVDIVGIQTMSTNPKTVGINNVTGTIGAAAPDCSTTPSTPNFWQATTSTIASTASQAWRFSPPASYTTTWTATTASGTTTLATGNNIFTQTVSPSVTTTYSISYTNQTTGCTNAPGSAQVVMTILPTTAPTGVLTTATKTSVCSNDTFTLGINYTGIKTSMTFQWQKSTNGGTTWTDITGATDTIAVSSVVDSTRYRCQMISCGGTPSYSSAILINALGGSIAASPANFCGLGGSTNLTFTPVGTPTSVTWTSLTSSATMGTSTTNTNTATVTESSDFKVDAVFAGGTTCPVFVSVGVYDLPSATVTTTANGVCPGTSATINSGLTAGNFTAKCISPVAPKTIPATATFLANNGVASVPLTSGTLDDGGWGSIPIGFNFNFFGTNFNSVNIGTNGVLQFGAFNSTALGDFTIGALPNTSDPLGAIFASANDLNAGTSGTPATYIQYWTEGMAPNRRFVVEYNVFQFGVSNIQNMQVVLYETTGVVDIVGLQTLSNNQKTVGINDVTGTIGAAAPNCATTPSTANFWQATTSTIASTAPQHWRFSPPVTYTTVWTATTASGSSTLASGNNIFSQSVSPTVTTTYSISYTNQLTGCANPAGSAQVVLNVLGTTPPSGVNTLSSLSPVCKNTPFLLSTSYTGSRDGQTYQWQQSTDSVTWTNITGATDSVLTTSIASTMFFRQQVTQCGGTASPTTAIKLLTNNPTPIALIHDTICGTSGMFNLGATASNTNDSLYWYNDSIGGTSIISGNTWTTPTLFATDTFWVEQVQYNGLVNGLGSTTAPTTATFSTAERGLVINATQPFVINSAEYFSSTTSVTNTVTVRLVDDATGVQVGSSIILNITHGATSGFNKMNLGINVPVGTFRLLASFTQSVDRLTTFTGYPLPLSTYGSITSGFDFGPSLTTYNYFHNISVSSSVCKGDRKPVRAQFVSPPALTLSKTEDSICSGSTSGVVTLTSATPSPAYTFAWTSSPSATAPTGSLSSGVTFNESNVGTYKYVVTGTQTLSSGKTCVNTDTFMLNVKAIPTAVDIAQDTIALCKGTSSQIVANGGQVLNYAILNEGFNTPTNNWTVINNSFGGSGSFAQAGFNLNVSPSVNAPTGATSNDTTQFYMANADQYGFGGVVSTELISPSFSLLNALNPKLTFAHHFEPLSDSVSVQISTNGGTTWTVLTNPNNSATGGFYTTAQGASTTSWKKDTFDLSAFTTFNSVMIKYKYTSFNFGFWYMLDNVSIVADFNNAKSWSPTTNLFVNSSLSTPYSTLTDTVFAAPNVTTKYYAISTHVNGCSTQDSVVLKITDTVVIATQPKTDTGVCQGQSFAVSVAASSTSPMTYQWKKWNGTAFVNIAGATSAIYSKSSAALADTGNYVCEISTGTPCSAKLTAIGHVSVFPGLSITKQPNSTGKLSICQGQPVSFVAHATGQVSQQWKKIQNGTVSNYSTIDSNRISSTQLSDSGKYFVEYTLGGICGKAYSDTVSISVTPISIISTDPTNQTVCQGSTATFAATTKNAVSVLWMKGSTTLTSGGNLTITNTTAGDSTVSTLAIANTTIADTGAYKIISVTGGTGCANDTSIANLYVKPSAVISTQPIANTYVLTGGTATLSITAANYDSIVWFNGTTRVGTGSPFTVTTNFDSATHAGAYTAKVYSNAPCTNVLTSSTANIIKSTCPAISVQPIGDTLCVGSSYTLRVTAGAVNTYSWFKVGSTTVLSTTDSLVVPLSTTTSGGKYYVQLSPLTGCSTTVTSDSVNVGVDDSTRITTQPVASTICENGTISMSVSATGTGTLSYQWKAGTTNVGTNSSSLSISSATTANSGTYTVIVSSTSSCPSITSANTAVLVNPAPTVSAISGNTPICLGTQLSLSATIANQSAIEWRKGTTLLSSTTSTHTVSAAALTDAGSYTVTAKALTGCTDVTSAAFTQVVKDTAKITTQPAATTYVLTGSTATLNITASNFDSIVWYKGTTRVGTGSPFTVTTSFDSATHAGAYTARVYSNAPCSGFLSSSVANLVKSTCPTIATQPIGDTVCIGSKYTMKVVAGAVGSYSWRKVGSPVTLSTTDSLVLNLSTLTSGGKFFVRLNPLPGCTTPTISDTVSIGVDNITTITTQPTATNNVCENNSLTLNTAATGSGTLTYQWFNGSSALTTGTSLAITGAQLTDSGNYKVVITSSGACPSVTSNIARVNVNAAPSLSAITGTSPICTNTSISLNATIANSASIEWRKDGNLLTGATTATYTKANATSADAGVYTVTVKALAGCADSSKSFTQAVNGLASITTQPVATNYVLMGNNLTLTVAASNAGTITWYKDGVTTGVTGTSYVINNFDSATHAGTYTAHVANLAPCTGDIVSNNAVVVKSTCPLISKQPKDTVVCQGNQFTLSVTAQAFGGYQWYRNGVALAGDTQATLTRTNLTGAEAGKYKVKILPLSGAVCSDVYSDSVTVMINNKPVITAQPSASTSCAPASHTLTVKAQYHASFQWYKDNVAIATGGTDTSYVVDLSNAANEGTYKVVALGTTGCPNTTSVDVVVKKRLPSTMVKLADSTSLNLVEQCMEGAWTYYATASKPDEFLLAISKRGNVFTSAPDVIVTNSIRDTVNTVNGVKRGYIFGKRYFNVDITSGNAYTPYDVRFFYSTSDSTDVMNAYMARKAAAVSSSFSNPSNGLMSWMLSTTLPFTSTFLNNVAYPLPFANAIVQNKAYGTMNGVNYVDVKDVSALHGGGTNYMEYAILTNGSGTNGTSSKDFGLKLYPVPVVSGTLNIDVTSQNMKPITFTIIDVTGRVIDIMEEAHREGTTTHTFDLSNYANGTYQVQIDNGIEQSVGKFTIVR